MVGDINSGMHQKELGRAQSCTIMGYFASYKTCEIILTDGEHIA